MLISDDEKEALVERRIGALEVELGEIRRRVDVNEERVVRVEERQNEQEGVLEEVRGSMQMVKSLILEKDRAWNLVKTLGVVCVIMGGFGLVWVLLSM